MNKITNSPEFAENVYNNWNMGWGWKISEANGGSIVIQTPVAWSFTLPESKTGWEDLLKSNLQISRLLWATSLTYIVDLEKSDPKKAMLVLDSFQEALNDSRKSLASNLTASWDHNIAMRLRALVALTHNPETKIGQRSLEILKGEIESEDFFALIVPNNHGLMLIEGLMYAAIALSTEKPSLSAEILTRSKKSIDSIISDVFGDDFYCNENSPFYHHFYIHKLSQMLDAFAHAPELDSIRDSLKSHIEKATETMRKITFPNGDLPGMGDSTPNRTKYGSTAGTHFSVRTGLWVHKTDEMFVSLKCGYSSLTHKHADDTSIVVKYGDDLFIADSGTANYDYSDLRVLALRSQRAHSGLFFTKYDQLHPAKIYRPEGKFRGGIYDPRDRVVRGAYSIEGKAFAHRILNVVSDSVFVIEDWASSVDGSEFVHRFIVPSEISVSMKPTSMTLTGKKYSLRMNFSTRMDAQIHSGQKESPFKGWISRKANEVESAQCIDLTIQNRSIDSVRFTSTITKNK